MFSYSLKSKLNAYGVMCMSYGMGIHVLWDIYIFLSYAQSSVCMSFGMDIFSYVHVLDI